MFNFNGEADLDFEYTMARTSQRAINYQVGDKFQLAILNGLLAAFEGSYCTALNSTIDGICPDKTPEIETSNPTADCGSTTFHAVLLVSCA